MKKVWEFFNGNKTLFGTLILAVVGAGVVPEHTFGYQFLMWLGGILAAGGVAHKLKKGGN
jgi:hypothetical protein